MVIIGVDSHKRTHTVVDGNGRKLAEKTVGHRPTAISSSSAGRAGEQVHLTLTEWAAARTRRRARDRTS
jgi:hypothetical protein